MTKVIYQTKKNWNASLQARWSVRNPGISTN